MIKVSPSILAADFSNLRQEITDLEMAGADMIHVDVMDGHFVPNLTFGPLILKAIRSYTKLALDVHLMIKKPENYIETYVKAGSDIITIHPESTMHLDRTLSNIRKLGVQSGVALLPASSPESLEYVLDNIDQITVMSVNPGFGGQEFMNNQLGKIEKIHKMIINSGISLSVDGGINDIAAKLCSKAGADILVSGSFIFNGNYQKQIRKLKN